MLDDACFQDVRLSTILEDVGARVVHLDPDRGAHPLDGEPPNLTTVALRGERQALERLEKARDIASGLGIVPVVAVTSRVEYLPTPGELRRYHVVASLGEHAAVDQVRYRLRQILYVGADRRVCPRVPCTVKVHVDAEGVITHEVSSNLSLTGLALRTTRRLAPDTELVLRFSLPGRSEPITTRASVVHLTHCSFDEYEVGAFFLELEREERNALYEFVRQVERAMVDPEAALELEGA